MKTLCHLRRDLRTRILKQSVSDGLHLGIRRNTYQNDGNFSGAVQAVLFHHQVASRTRDRSIGTTEHAKRI